MALQILTPEEVNAAVSVPTDKRVHKTTLGRTANLLELTAEGIAVGSAFVVAEGDETHEKDGKTVAYSLATILQAYKSLVKKAEMTEKVAVSKAIRKSDGTPVVEVRRVK